jgi:hypothetical protein
MKALLLVLFSSFAFAGTYTPTLTNVQYAYAMTSHQAEYFVTDSVLHVAGVLDSSFDSSFVNYAEILISLPVSSSLSSQYDCSGVVGEGPHYNIGHIEADAGSDSALLVINPSLSTTPPDEAPLTLHYMFDCVVK